MKKFEEVLSSLPLSFINRNGECFQETGSWVHRFLSDIYKTTS